MFWPSRRPKIKRRYVVRTVEVPPPDRYQVMNKQLGSVFYWIVFDAQTTDTVYKEQGSEFDAPSRNQAHSHASILNRRAHTQAINPYIFDCLTGAMR